MADHPEPMDVTDLPLLSLSNVLTKAQGAAALTSATPSAEPPTIAPRKSKAEKQREYRQRIAASRTPEQVLAARKSDAERQRNCRLSKIHTQAIATRKSDAERQRNYRLRKAAKSALVSGLLDSTTASFSLGARSNDVQTAAVEPAQIIVQPGISSDQIELAQSTWITKWASSIMRFKSTFLDNDFGYACSVCDRLWFKNDLKPITAAQLEVISEWFIKEKRQLCREEYEMVCHICKRTLNKKSMPPLAKVNGFSYPDQPPGLPPLDPISERLISPRLPFMQVRRLRHDLSYGIIEQVINVPVDVQEMVKWLPRELNEDDVINVNIKRKLAHKSTYISGYMSKSTISAWLTVLQESPLYRLYDINVDLSRLQPTVPFLDDIQDDPSNRIENISNENTPELEILASRQHIMMWNEEDCLNITPGHQATPPNIIYDNHAEELSFPSIYFGEPRRFNKGVLLTPYMIAASEIRRRDRRGATPQKILYVAMKILRLRMVDGIYSTFRNVSVTETVTRRMLEDTEFVKEYVIQNLAFMKTVPNSVQYWASRKRDLFAIIRQLGKPTVFLTIGANEIRWTKLLTILLKLSKKYPGKTAKDLNISERCTLVSDDPVTCCIYFYKLVSSLMKMLKSKQTYNPFGKYFVKDYFLCIEFQHRGSPQAHILLWLNDDPRETVSENMLRTVDLVEKICSVSRDDVPNNVVYVNQIHTHTFSCTKRGETSCKFGIPYWPMSTTRVLVPIPESDGRRKTLQQKAKELGTSLSEGRYTCMDEFLNTNGLTYDSYLDIVRSTLRRPTLMFKRNFDELMTNTFNPYLAGEVNSNIEIQFILDEYSCAEYVVEYVNKSARGMNDLRRELTTMMQEHPDRDYTGQLKALSLKFLNSVEMTAQEAAWYLLRQPMSETSCQVVYIPTVWPAERQRCRKRRQQMDREGIDADSTDVWTKNIIQRYEERPASLEEVYLAEFASWYANANDFVDEEDDVQVDDDGDSEAVPETRTSRAPKEYRRRQIGRVIRYRRYDIDETVDYKREMVLLYVQFRNEISEILDQNKFLQLFDDNKDTIMERRSLFEMNLNIENVTKELEAMAPYSCFELPNDMSNYMELHLMGPVSQVQNKPECVPSNSNDQPNKKKRKSGATPKTKSIAKFEKQLDHGAVSSRSSDPVTNEDVNALFHIQLKADKACQTNLFSESERIETTVSCNRFIEIGPKLIPRYASNMNYVQSCSKKTYADKWTVTDSEYFDMSNTSEVTTIKSEHATGNAEYSELATVKSEPATESEELFEITVIKSEPAESQIEEVSEILTNTEPTIENEEFTEIATVKSESAMETEEFFEISTIKIEPVSEIEDYSEILTTNTEPTIESKEFTETATIKTEPASDIKDVSDTLATNTEPATGFGEYSEITIKTEQVSELEDYSEILAANTKPTT